MLCGEFQFIIIVQSYYHVQLMVQLNSGHQPISRHRVYHLMFLIKVNNISNLITKYSVCLLLCYWHNMLNALICYTDEIPTSVDYVRDIEGQFVASYNSSHCVIYDIETKSPITRLECSKVNIYKLYILICKIMCKLYVIVKGSNWNGNSANSSS